MRSDIELFVSNCPECNVNRPKLFPYKGRYTNLETSQLNKTLHLDSAGPYSKDSFGYVYTLVMVEASTRFTIFEPLKNKTANFVCKAVANRYICFFGIPSCIHLGTEFRNSLLSKLCHTLFPP